MADTLVEQQPQAPHKLQDPSSTPGSDAFGQDGDQYAEYKRLQRELEYINLQEEYIKDEQRYVGVPEGASGREADAQPTGV